MCCKKKNGIFFIEFVKTPKMDVSRSEYPIKMTVWILNLKLLKNVKCKINK